ncbi:MAG: pentapeptide repeat-containing protein [Cyanobacteria bacterium J06626_6]
MAELSAEEFRNRYRDGERDFRGMDLSGLTYLGTIDGADFSGANLSDCDFVDRYVEESNFTRADLRRSTSCFFVQCNLKDANLSSATYESFGNCDLRGCDFTSHRFQHQGSISRCDASNAIFRESIFTGDVRFKRSSFRNSQWSNVGTCSGYDACIWLSGADFTGASIVQSIEVMEPQIFIGHVTLVNGKLIEQGVNVDIGRSVPISFLIQGDVNY